MFACATIGSVFVHELGHALAGWLIGLPVVPTLAKTYVLRDAIAWHDEIRISAGGVTATALLVAVTLVWYVRSRRPVADAVLAGVLTSPAFYTLRFALAGRGHDGLEWQEAQAAVGLPPAGHAIDLMLALLFAAGIAAWLLRHRAVLDFDTFRRAAGIAALGVALLVAIQVANNAVFDRHFRETAITGVPAALDQGR